MEQIFFIATVWIGLAVLSTIIAYHLRISIALVEICVGILVAAIANYYIGGSDFIGSNSEWLRFLASTGAVLLTFLAGAELDPRIIKTKWKEVSVVGFIGFLAPFLGCATLARYVLHWDPRASLLAGVALSTTSMAVVYAVMLETGFNKTEFGKGILGACFVNDLGTVIVLGLLFAPFTYKSIIFILVSALVLSLFPFFTKQLTNIYGNRTAAIRAKWVVFVLFGLGALAYWSGSEAVLPAYIAGILVAEFATKEEHWVRRFRTLTVGFLTPFYFLRAGTLVYMPALIACPVVFLVLLTGKVFSKIFGLYPVIGLFRKQRLEKWYYTLMMSTGLTFGTISAIYGFSHGIVTKQQYSFLVAAVIASAVIPTMIANLVFLPKHLLAELYKGKHEKISEGGIDED
ncbi:MAG: cation:proton antiporter [Candidatus Omnitrophica bacterium]|nr:cation:proton antiporter [Candidatus Omnitrophota bacterium]